MQAKSIKLQSLMDSRGSLVIAEGMRTIPFDIKRVYYIFGNKDNEPRGFHAHKSLQQAAFCIQGSCKFLLDDGKSKQDILLNNPAEGILIGNMTWREMYDFSPDCILMVFASDYYDEKDYIRDYKEFKSLVQVKADE